MVRRHPVRSTGLGRRDGRKRLGWLELLWAVLATLMNIDAFIRERSEMRILHHHPLVSIDVLIQRNTSCISDVPTLVDHKLDN